MLPAAAAVAAGETGNETETIVAALQHGTPDSLGALIRARDALYRLADAAPLDDPLLVVALDALRLAGDPVDERRLLQHFAQRNTRYGRANPHRFRWSLSYQSEPGSVCYAASPDRPRVHWRPGEGEWLERDASAYGRRLMEPVVLASQFGYWGRVIDDAQTQPEVAALASALLDEAQPVAEHDLAAMFVALDPWRDTFALRLLSQEPHTAARFRDLLFGLAIRYGSLAARDGVVRGVRHPWHQRPLVSATAQLASGLWHWGVYPSLIPALVSFVSLSRNSDGSWGDEAQPSDVLTTLAAADLMARLDPGFDPAPTVRWLIERQEPDGWWRALDPEVPWLTSAVARWLVLVELPFHERFSWPTAPIWTRDRMTGLTTLAGVDELVAVLGALPRLSAEPMEVAFLDLAGFRAFNKRHGSQAEGDRVLGLLGTALRDLPDILPARIGGDEMLMLGKPGDRIGPKLDAWRAAWPARLRAAGFSDKVAPRILVGEARARDVDELRRELGEAIFRMKQIYPETPPEGVQARLSEGLVA
jgi:GGDEF domain-containing protein